MAHAKECKECKDSGFCSWCKGTGRERHSLDCRGCRGSGQCFACGGKTIWRADFSETETVELTPTPWKIPSIEEIEEELFEDISFILDQGQESCPE